MFQVLIVSATLYPYTHPQRPELGEMYVSAIEMHKGWNLVPAFNMNYDLSTLDRSTIPKSEYKPRGPIFQDSDIQKEDVKAMYYYSVAQKKYFNLYPNVNEAWDNVYKDADAYGFDLNNEEEDTLPQEYMLTSAVWLYSNKNGLLRYEMQGSSKMKEIMKNRKLLKGFNFVVIPYADKEPILDEFSGTCKIQKVYIFDSENNKWIDSFPLSQLLRDGTGLGIVIKVEENCQLGVAGTPERLPSLPD